MRIAPRCATALLGLVAAASLTAPSALAAKSQHAPASTPQKQLKTKTTPQKKSKSSQGTSLPVEEMETALQAKGSVSGGVLAVPIVRTDIPNVHIGSVPIKPAFEINGDLTFQPIGKHEAFFNGDIPVKPGEIDGVISAIIASGLTFQAEHQHMYDYEPIVWFIHFRGKGDPLQLATEVHSVLKATSTPLPQEPPEHPTTPLDKAKLKSILHGYEASVSEDGVVTVDVARRNPIHIDGVLVKPETNIPTNISFEPLNAAGTEVAAIADIAMEANEVDPVMRVMRAQGWDIGCLYNQETDEHPQLFFSHQFKTGNPYTLAEEIRNGLNQTNSH